MCSVIVHTCMMCMGYTYIAEGFTSQPMNMHIYVCMYMYIISPTYIHTCAYTLYLPHMYKKYVHTHMCIYNVHVCTHVHAEPLTRFLTHLLAWPCGSMNRGHLLENWTTTPFSTDSVSFGRPAICHCRILTGSPRVEMRVAEWLWGALYSESLSCHWWTSLVRYSPWERVRERGREGGRERRER